MAGMSDPRRITVCNALVAVGAIVGIPAAFVSRLVQDPLSPIGYYGTGLALIGFGIAMVGAYIGKARDD